MNNHALPPRRIVGVDGSAQSRAALLWAATRSAADGVVLVLAHVANPQDESGGGETLLAAAAHSLLSQHPALRIERMLLHGPVWRALAAAAHPDDLLVIGTGPSGYPARRVTGSLGVQLVIAASCTIALIPDVDLRFRRGVVAGIGRPESSGTIARAIAAHAPDRPITLVHADPSGRCEKALAAAEEALGPDAAVRRRLLSGPAADALLDAALDKELLVLGPGADGADRPPIGAVTHAVLMNATAPILLSR